MQALTFFFAFVAVLALIGVVAWLIRRFASNRLGANTQRGRMPRLAVIDAAAVDGRRRLVLVRRDNVEHLIMIGGPESYGAGGWQNTAVEKALPVDSEIQSLEVMGKGGLVLIMHASEMADGNLLQKRIAKLAVERLTSTDEVGIMARSVAIFRGNEIALRDLQDRQAADKARDEAEKRALLAKLADSFERDVLSVVSAVSQAGSSRSSSALSTAR